MSVPVRLDRQRAQRLKVGAQSCDFVDACRLPVGRVSTRGFPPVVVLDSVQQCPFSRNSADELKEVRVAQFVDQGLDAADQACGLRVSLQNRRVRVLLTAAGTAPLVHGRDADRRAVSSW
ncbi:MAG: hypothetical protein ACXIUP_03790 [Microcella sp.]|jgi:hypothetical protein